MDVTLQTITPIHIGNGEELYDLDYAVHGGYYYRISQKTVLDFLAQIPEGPEQYASWIERNSNEMDGLKQRMRYEKDRHAKRDFNQQLARMRKGFNLISFSRKINQEGKFINYLKTAKNVYKIPFKGELEGQVRGAIKTATGKPYIPGSSLKGAIRTALLHRYLSEFADAEQIKNTIAATLSNARRNPKRLRYAKKTFADRLEQLAFYCHTKKGDRLKRDDEKFDLFKLLKVSDGYLPDTPEKTMRLADVNLYLVGKEKNRQTGKLDFKATTQGQTSFVEAVKEYTSISFRLNIDLNFLLQFKEEFKRNQIRQGEKTHWIGIVEKVKNTFGLDLSTLTTDNLKEKEKEVYQHIFDSLKIFSEKQLAHQKKWLANFIQHDKRRDYDEEIERGHEVIFGSNANRLIHFGFGTGFTGITEYLHLLEKPELRPILKEVMELFLIGDKPGAQRNRKGSETYIANPDKFPKSRRLIREEHTIQPMGWAGLLLPGEKLEIAKVSFGQASIVAPVEPAKAVFFKGQLNPKKRPEMDAEVIHSGRPNKVKVYVSPDYTPEVQLDGYRNPLGKGKIIVVSVGISKKKQITQASFIREKK